MVSVTTWTTYLRGASESLIAAQSKLLSSQIINPVTAARFSKEHWPAIPGLVRKAKRSYEDFKSMKASDRRISHLHKPFCEWLKHSLEVVELHGRQGEALIDGYEKWDSLSERELVSSVKRIDDFDSRIRASAANDVRANIELVVALLPLWYYEPDLFAEIAEVLTCLHGKIGMQSTEKRLLFPFEELNRDQISPNEVPSPPW